MNALKDIKEMKLVRWMGLIAFIITELLIVKFAFQIETRDAVGLLTVQAGVFGIIFGAVTGKNIIQYKRDRIKAE